MKAISAAIAMIGISTIENAKLSNNLNTYFAIRKPSESFGYYCGNGTLYSCETSDKVKANSSFTNHDIVGVKVDMINGKLAFSYNGSIGPDVVQGDFLFQHVFYPALAVFRGDHFELHSIEITGKYDYRIPSSLKNQKTNSS